jgi:hypothetical protein
MIINEIERVAGLGNALRPDWSIKSLRTILIRDHSHRSYRDAALAMAWIATDPATRLPGRLSEQGPWWEAAARTDPNPPQPPRWTPPEDRSTVPPQRLIEKMRADIRAGQRAVEVVE